MKKRAFKIGLSVSLCVLATKFKITDSSFYSSLAVVITFQNSIYASLKAGENRIKGTLLGGIIGVICALVNTGNFLLTGLGVALIILICNRLKWTKSINIACIVFIAIMVNISKLGIGPIGYSLQRVQETLLGIVLAVVVNYFVLPEKYEQKIYEHIRSTFREIKILCLEKYHQKKVVPLQNLKRYTVELENLIEEYKKEKKVKKYAFDIEKLDYILLLIRRVSFHLEILNSMSEENKLLNKENNEKLKYLFRVDSEKGFMETEESIAYNYHTKIIVDDFMTLQEFRYDLR